MMGIETMKNVSPKTVDRSTLVQRSSIRLDPAAPREDRLREFIKQIRNPYCYLDGKTVVKISFAETDKDAVMKALQDIYWESKARNVEKYTPKKYKKTGTDAEE